MAEKGNGAGTDMPPRDPGPADGQTGRNGPQGDPVNDGAELRARIDRLGDIVARGIDLAEAGMSLGLTLLTTVGAAAQHKIVEKMAGGMMGDGEPGAGPGGPPMNADGPGPGVSGVRMAGAPTTAPAAELAAYVISNRLPVTPGAPFSVSFSLNNEDDTAPKPVSLVIEPLTGERTGAVVTSQFLAVVPSEAVIAPLDFEKFALRGALPPEMPADIYCGAVLVDGAMRIPVRLAIGLGGAG
jgi:hypothetical protein